MAYVINRWDGQAITTIEDGTVDQSLDIKLIGKNYAGYGELQNENFVHMLENFARDAAPSNAVRGQIWYDTVTKKIKFYTGDQVAGVKVWKTAGGVEYGTEPANPTVGDLWFDSSKSQLKVRSTNSSWLTIGPQAAGSGTTQLVSRVVEDNQGNQQSIIAATVNDQIVYIISREEFTLAETEVLTGFSGQNSGIIKKGLTLPYTNSNGISSTSHIYWGTASVALGLKKTDGSFISANDIGNAIGTLGSFDDDGFTVGNDQDLKVFVEDGISPIIENQEGETLTFRVTQGTTTKKTPLVLTTLAIEPGANTQYTLGTTTKQWSNVYATTFTGTATQASTLSVGGDFRVASISAGANTIAARDANGNLTAGVFSGVATSARYADLAEKYITDQTYEPGTVVTVGGTAEVRASVAGDRALGAVSTNPAFMMNKNLENGTYIALKGRVPVKVIGEVAKGDRLVATDGGCAIKARPDQYHDVFALALEDSADAGIKIVECVIL